MDAVAAISGVPGIGKSTEGITCCIAEKKLDTRKTVESFDYSKHIAWSRKELYELVDQTKRNTILVDEAISLLYKRESTSAGQISLIKLLNRCRKKNHSIYFIIPRFSDIDVTIRNSRIKFWIHAIARGKAFLFMRDDDNIGSEDPWYLKEISDVLMKRDFNKLEDIPTYLGLLLWEKLPKDHFRAYRYVSEIHAGKDSSENNEQLQEVKSAKDEGFKEGRQQGLIECIHWLKQNGVLRRGATSAFMTAMQVKYKDMKNIIKALDEKVTVIDKANALIVKNKVEMEKKYGDSKVPMFEIKEYEMLKKDTTIKKDEVTIINEIENEESDLEV